MRREAANRVYAREVRLPSPGLDNTMAQVFERPFGRVASIVRSGNVSKLTGQLTAEDTCPLVTALSRLAPYTPPPKN
jgi:hypothetical protein